MKNYIKIIIAVGFVSVIGLYIYYQKNNTPIVQEEQIPLIDDVKIETIDPILSEKLPADSIPVGDSKIIESNTWVWQKTIMNDGAIIIPKKIGDFTLSFDSKGNVSGKTDCNSFSGSYEIGSDGVITFGPMASTLMYCDGSQESLFTKAINNSNRYMIDDSRNLVLLLAYDSGSVLFKKQ